MHDDRTLIGEHKIGFVECLIVGNCAVRSISYCCFERQATIRSNRVSCPIHVFGRRHFSYEFVVQKLIWKKKWNFRKTLKSMKKCDHSKLTRRSIKLNASHMAAPSSTCALCIAFRSSSFLTARMNIIGDGFSNMRWWFSPLWIASDAPRSNAKWLGMRTRRHWWASIRKSRQIAS